MCDTEDYQRQSYIMRVQYKDYDFICNRNSEQWTNIFSDACVRWWECGFLSEMSFDLDGVFIDILEIVDVDNYERRHQKLLNSYKKKYIEEFNSENEENVKLSNSLFNKASENYRKQFHDELDKYKKIIDEHWSSLQKDLYEYAKKLFYKQNNDWFLNYTRWQIWNFDKISLYERALCIMLRDHILERRRTNEKYPFDKGYIKKQIKNIIRNRYYV